MDTTNRKPMHYVIIIPGLGDYVGHIEMATGNWPRSGLHPIVFPIGWHNHETFETKLQKLCTLVDKLSKTGSEISVVGCSAGGSAALNLFIERSHALKNAVSVCGMLREGHRTGLRSFSARPKPAPPSPNR